jgi:hypothetical protein
MKKIFIGLIGLTFLLIAAAAFANPWGMMGGKSGQITAEQQKFFDETKEMRKAMHDKKFELMEAYRSGTPDEQKIDGLEKEIAGIREKIQDKAKELGVTTGPGDCGNQGMNCQKFSKADGPGCGQFGNCYQNSPRNCCGPMQGRMMR